jgi:hypothetical protein
MSAQADRRRTFALVCVIALCAMALRSSAVFVGLMSDDFMQHAMLAGSYPGEGYVPFDLYGFLRGGETIVAHVEQGTAPWWSVPELHGTVLRPLASVLLWLDHVVAPDRVVLWHVHSLLWFGAAIVAFGLVVLRLLPRSIALLAVVLFACEAGFVSPLAWLANRCALIGLSFGLLAIRVHLEWRTPEPSTPAWLRRRGPIVEAVLMALCMGAGEYGLGIFAYLLGWEWFVGAQIGRPWARARAIARALAPALIPVALYLLAHKLLGYGTFGAEVYADPFHTPRGYAYWASKRLPQLMTAAFWSIPAATIHVFRFAWSERVAEFWLGDPPPPAFAYHAAHVRMAWWGVAVAVVIVALARRGLHEAERRVVRALVVGGLLGLLPIAVAPAHSRLLVIAQLGACTLIAAVIVASLRLLLGRAPQATPAWMQRLLDAAGDRRAALLLRLRGVVLVPVVALLAWVHTIGDLRWGHAYTEHIDTLQLRNIAAFTQGDILDHELRGRDVVILNAPSQALGLYGGYVLHANGWPMPATWRPLALGGEFAMFATRTGTHTLDLAAIQGTWLRTAGELFFRREDQPLDAGDVLAYPSLRAEILAAEYGRPTKVRFTFERPLEELLFVASTPKGLRVWSVPEVGKFAMIPLPRLPPVEDRSAVRFPAYPGP